MRYCTYSEHMQRKHGEKVYKIPINIPVSCPNRDGTLSDGGCIFCGEKGAGFENLSNTMSIQEQLEKNILYIRKKYKAYKYVAYFQNYSNTYLPIEKLEEYAEAASLDNVVELSFSTRPDCISDAYLEKLASIATKLNKEVSIELGLQTVNYHTLNKINRGHTLAEFIDAVIRIKKFKFEVCAHVILNLPWDDQEDVIETAKILTALSVEQVKLHALYIEKNTKMCELYQQGKIEIISLEAYVNRVILFLQYLSPNTIIQRVAGRAPEEDTVFCNWNTSWWKIKDRIEEKMEQCDTLQGEKCDYLNGKALNVFEKTDIEKTDKR